MSKDLLFSSSARQSLLTGINKVAESVGATLGPRGRNVAIAQPYGGPRVLHDGVSVANSIDLTDPFEDIGAQLVKEAARKTNEAAGDGTTTATVLTQALATEGIRLVEAKQNPMVLKREIEEAYQEALDLIRALSRKVETKDEIRNIATISSASPELGAIVAEAISKVGQDGVVTVEEGKSWETTVDYKQGMEFDRGYLSPYFVTDQDRVEAVVKNPYILLTDMKINHNLDLVPFLNKFLATGNQDLVIVAGEVVEEALATLVVNKLRGAIRVIAIQAPAYGGRRVDELEDLAALTGGVAILSDAGRKLDSIDMTELGRAEKVIADRDSTKIINGLGSKKAVKARMAELRSQIKVSNTEFDSEIKKQRLAKLAGGVAVINVGAATQVEMSDKKERVIDAKNATQAAIEEGIVSGGEITLLEVSKRLTAKSMGADVLRQALRAPFRRLVENAGFDYAEVWGQLSGAEYPMGLDVMDGQVKNLIEAGIIDPVKVTRSALENAVSVATMSMTTEVSVADHKEEK